MEAFLVSPTTIAVAEIGDRTQLLSLVLVARYRKPLPIIAGILCATLANHGAAGLIGLWFGSLLKPKMLEILVAVSMIAMAPPIPICRRWCLVPRSGCWRRMCRWSFSARHSPTGCP
jgi:putative Ca2+/H+ antiporter (TMEM165/GDT1 family)